MSFKAQCALLHLQLYNDTNVKKTAFVVFFDTFHPILTRYSADAILCEETKMGKEQKNEIKDQFNSSDRIMSGVVSMQCRQHE